MVPINGTHFEISGREAEHAKVTQFLAEEAALLDQNLLWEWYEWLADDFVYEIPIRVNRDRADGGEFPAGAYRQKDNRATIKQRIERLDTGHAWAEDPPTRTVRILSNTALTDIAEDGVISAQSSILLYREQVRDVVPELIAGRRIDRIRFNDAGGKLVSRTVWLAHTTLNTANLGVFL